jgi:PTS system beta-glucosides-specific IIC component
MVAAAVFAQAGAVLGVFLKARDQKLKALAGSSTVAAIFGVTEPAIYGVTLKLKKPFIYACISGAIGGAIIGVGSARASAFALASLLAVPSYVGTGFIYAVIGLAVAFVLAALLVYILGFEQSSQQEAVQTAESVSPQGITLAKEVIVSPLDGLVKPLHMLEDEAFASGAMGQGIVIEPADGVLTSPVNGTITTVFPTGHAIGITSDGGAELLIHVGVNTVRLKGRFFEKHVQEGDKVEKGQLLLKFDVEQIREAGYLVSTPVIVTNSATYLDVLKTDKTEVKNGDYLLTTVIE